MTFSAVKTLKFFFSVMRMNCRVSASSSITSKLGSLRSTTPVVGSMVQKSPLASGDLRSASAVQNIGAAAVLLLMALALGQPHWDGSAQLWSYLGFAVLVLSLGGATLLIWLMRHGEATRTAALLLAVPPLAAVEAS